MTVLQASPPSMKQPVFRYRKYEKDGQTIIDFDEGIFCGYRWYDKEQGTPLYAFGHGLSYTKLRYSDLTVNGQTVSFTVTNTGDITGTEIAQVYLGKASVPSHIQSAQKQLCGFARIEQLSPGESRRVSVSIPDRSLCYWDPQSDLISRPDGTKGKRVRATGTRSIYVGPSSAVLPLCSEITVL